MSAYCAQADMTARYETRLLIQLTDLPASDASPPATAIVGSVLAQAIADVSAEIDTYLAVVYALPLDLSLSGGVTPPALLSAACTLTLARLYEQNGGIALPEKVKDAASQARSWLRRIASRDARLYPDAQDDAAGNAEGAGLVETNDLKREFSMRNLRDVL